MGLTTSAPPQPALPKISEEKNPLESFLLDFFGSKQRPHINYLPKGQPINTEYYSSLLVQLKDILKEENRQREIHQGVLDLE